MESVNADLRKILAKSNQSQSSNILNSALNTSPETGELHLKVSKLEAQIEEMKREKEQMEGEGTKMIVDSEVLFISAHFFYVLFGWQAGKVEELESIVKKKDMEAKEALIELERLDEYSKTLGIKLFIFPFMIAHFKKTHWMKCKNIVTL